ncbi:MAG: GDYXXLXY domain-containing protein, partial [candidate division NC10 bacterium]|nr:GDYXXLXY domain-containing protein [candidate division NC10 bacterium]
KQWTLSTGIPVVLETQPIDPRSLFQGDYVRLNYTISTLDLAKLSSDRPFKAHERIYVLLRKGNPYWAPVSLHHERPGMRPNHVSLKGMVMRAGSRRWNQASQSWEATEHLMVRYGIENYFVPEGEGRDLERPKPGEKVSICVAVDQFGNAGIKAVLVNGQSRYTETLF